MILPILLAGLVAWASLIGLVMSIITVNNAEMFWYGIALASAGLTLRTIFKML